MKVIGFTGNFGDEGCAPQAFLMADSSILYTGRPFFIPDFAQRFVAAPTIIVRMGRLGKCVAPKFAHRYWDAFTAGFTVRAVESDDARLVGLDWAFDGAAIVGDWIAADQCDDVLHVPVKVEMNDEVVAQRCLADMNRRRASVAASRWATCCLQVMPEMDVQSLLATT